MAAKSEAGCYKGNEESFPLFFSPQLGQKARSGGEFFFPEAGGAARDPAGRLQRKQRGPADWRNLYGELRIATADEMMCDGPFCLGCWCLSGAYLVGREKWRVRSKTRINYSVVAVGGWLLAGTGS